MTCVASERSTGEYVRGALCGLLAVSIWAANIVVGGLGLRSSLTPWDIAAIRFSVAGLVLLPYLIQRGAALDRLGWMGLAALVLGGAPTVLLSNAGLLFAPAAHAGALFPGVMPLMVVALAVPMLNERFTLPRWTRFLDSVTRNTVLCREAAGKGLTGRVLLGAAPDNTLILRSLRSKLRPVPERGHGTLFRVRRYVG
jgi:hypothetical protein